MASSNAPRMAAALTSRGGISISSVRDADGAPPPMQRAQAVSVCTMYDFHDSTDILVNPSFLPFCTQNNPELALKTGIFVPKVTYDLPEFKIRPQDHIAIIHT